MYGGKERTCFFGFKEEYILEFLISFLPFILCNLFAGYAVYHSLYDDFIWMEKFGDPIFHRHVAGILRFYSTCIMLPVHTGYTVPGCQPLRDARECLFQLREPFYSVRIEFCISSCNSSELLYLLFTLFETTNLPRRPLVSCRMHTKVCHIFYCHPPSIVSLILSMKMNCATLLHF
jgi:hypothetical protein